MSDMQMMINQINGIINCLPERDKEKLPDTLKKYFSENASVLPDEAIDKNKTLEQQNITDETLLMLSFINEILNKNN